MIINGVLKNVYDFVVYIFDDDYKMQLSILKMFF